MNYLIVTAIICEFCNKFIYSSFDTLVCQYGSDRYALSSFQFRSLLLSPFTHSLISTLGSAINIFQTGFLFQWLIDRRGVSIPSIGCLAGLVGGRVSCFLSSSGLLHSLRHRPATALFRRRHADHRRLRILLARRSHHSHRLSSRTLFP